MRPLYIFDLDGTLALIDHRRHHVEGPKKDWPAFYRDCVNDVPNKAVISVLRIIEGDTDNDIWIWSGRSNEVKFETIEWLRKHGIRYHYLRMRTAGDYTPDDTLKMSWYTDISPDDRFRLVATFDDRDRMVKAWRAAGVTCFQVAPGDF